MKIKPPFILLQTEDRYGSTWHLAARCLRRLNVYKSFPRTVMALVWKYAPCQYLGQTVDREDGRQEWRLLA